MKQSYIPHFTYILLAHALLLCASWQMKTNESELIKTVQQTFFSPGKSKLYFRIATSQVIAASPRRLMSPKNLTPNPNKPAAQEKTQSSPVVNSTVSQGAVTQEGISGSGSLSAAGKVSVRDLYYSEIRSHIEQNKAYPLMSRRLGQQGLVIVAFTLLEDGHIINLRIDTPSRYDLLNSSALDAVKKVHKFRPIPKELEEASLDIKVPIRFFTI